MIKEWLSDTRKAYCTLWLRENTQGRTNSEEKLGLRAPWRSYICSSLEGTEVHWFSQVYSHHATGSYHELWRGMCACRGSGDATADRRPGACPCQGAAGRLLPGQSSGLMWGHVLWGHMPWVKAALSDPHQWPTMQQPHRRAAFLLWCPSLTLQLRNLHVLLVSDTCLKEFCPLLACGGGWIWR